MDASMKMEVDVFTNVSVDDLGRETKLSVLSNLDVDIGESNANKREEQEGVEHGGWQERWGNSVQSTIRLYIILDNEMIWTS
jgi:hypothetical protein